MGTRAEGGRRCAILPTDASTAAALECLWLWSVAQGQANGGGHGHEGLSVVAMDVGRHSEQKVGHLQADALLGLGGAPMRGGGGGGLRWQQACGHRVWH